MSYNTVYYIPLNTQFYSDKSFNPIIRQTELVDKSYPYTSCPVFNHYNNRTFIVSSPIDLSFSVKRTTNSTNNELCVNIDVDNVEYYKDLLYATSDDLKSPLPVFQLKIPRFLFWTYENDMWFNFLDHPMTSYSNNLIAVSGWFNLSNYTRSSSFAFTMVDESKPVIIKKGDPLHRLSFIYPNLNDGIVLKEEKDPEKIAEIKGFYKQKSKSRRIMRSWERKLFSKTNSKSKCPIGFLFK